MHNISSGIYCVILSRAQTPTMESDMKETVLSRSLRNLYLGGALAGAALGMAAAPAQAQNAPVAQAGQPMARVEITGSNIRRSEAETSSAVQTLNRADIEKSGRTSVADLLQTLAVDNQGSVPTNFGAGFAQGASGISLRGLGAASTLVLLNGRRVAPYGLADDGQKVFTDLNIIPTDAVERVEILKSGASAIYGSDAIAGVVNIILRKDFVGTSVRGNFGESRYWDGRDARLALTTASATWTRTATTCCSALNTAASAKSGTATATSAATSAVATCGPGAFRPRKR